MEMLERHREAAQESSTRKNTTKQKYLFLVQPSALLFCGIPE